MRGRTAGTYVALKCNGNGQLQGLSSTISIDHEFCSRHGCLLVVLNRLKTLPSSQCTFIGPTPTHVWTFRTSWTSQHRPNKVCSRLSIAIEDFSGSGALFQHQSLFNTMVLSVAAVAVLCFPLLSLRCRYSRISAFYDVLSAGVIPRPRRKNQDDRALTAVSLPACGQAGPSWLDRSAKMRGTEQETTKDFSKLWSVLNSHIRLSCSYLILSHSPITLRYVCVFFLVAVDDLAKAELVNRRQMYKAGRLAIECKKNPPSHVHWPRLRPSKSATARALSNIRPVHHRPARYLMMQQLRNSSHGLSLVSLRHRRTRM
jgi:hypothetical protein